MSHGTCMSHDTHMSEPWHLIHGTWMSHGTHMTESYHTYEYTWGPGIALLMNESCHTCEWVMTHMWKSDYIPRMLRLSLTPTRADALTCTCRPATHTRTRTHVHTNTRAHAYTHTYPHIRPHTHTLSLTHTRTYTHIWTQTEQLIFIFKLFFPARLVWGEGEVHCSHTNWTRTFLYFLYIRTKKQTMCAKSNADARSNSRNRRKRRNHRRDRGFAYLLHVSMHRCVHALCM